MKADRRARKTRTIISEPIPYRVIYADTDAMGVVYNANYLRIFEMARTEAMRAMGIPYSEMERGGTSLPVVEAYVRYRSPARYDDLITAVVRTGLAGPASLRFDYELRSADGAVLFADGYTVHAAVDVVRGRPARLPASIAALFESSGQGGAQVAY
jgi:acyl-CoA thioester hydrolase